MINKTENLSKDEMSKRAIKYIIEWLSIALAMKFVLSKDIDTASIVIVSTIGVVTFALLDMYLPPIK